VQKFGEIGQVFFLDMRADRHTDTLITELRTRTDVEVIKQRAIDSTAQQQPNTRSRL